MSQSVFIHINSFNK